MGGGLSKFEDNNWSLADGKLSNVDETTDGAPPTAEYMVYHLNKRGVNQRAYDVVDEEANLLYSTRAVEGTLAWFDVLGKGINEYLLRVQVDLSRRYWVVYRYGLPTFAGQIADMDATKRLGRKLGHADFLYRKACVTVTWSRFHAVVNLYRAPTATPSLETCINSDAEEDKVDPGLFEGSPDAELHTGCDDEEAYQQDNGEAVKSAEPAASVPRPSGKEQATHSEVHASRAKGSTEAKNPNDTVAPQRTSSADADEFGEELDGGPPSTSSHDDHATTPTPTMEFKSDWDLRRSLSRSHKWKQWVSTKAVATVEYVNSNPYTPNDTAEGVILLDRPTLKCQEINSFTGQHQTMLIKDDEVQELREDEIRANIEEHQQGVPTLNASQSQCESDVVHESAPVSRISPWKKLFSVRSVARMDQHIERSSSKRAVSIQSDCFSMSSDERHSVEAPPCAAATSAPRVGLESKDICAASKEAIDVTDSVARIESDLNGTANHDLAYESGSEYQNVEKIRIACNEDAPEGSYGSDSTEDFGRAAEDQFPLEQPLVGYWSWENTYRVHKMKMHVAKRSDLCLHVVLAIVTNQLRYERNAVAVTV